MEETPPYDYSQTGTAESWSTAIPDWMNDLSTPQCTELFHLALVHIHIRNESLQTMLAKYTLQDYRGVDLQVLSNTEVHQLVHRATKQLCCTLRETRISPYKILKAFPWLPGTLGSHQALSKEMPHHNSDNPIRKNVLIGLKELNVFFDRTLSASSNIARSNTLFLLDLCQSLLPQIHTCCRFWIHCEVENASGEIVRYHSSSTRLSPTASLPTRLSLYALQISRKPHSRLKARWAAPPPISINAKTVLRMTRHYFRYFQEQQWLKSMDPEAFKGRNIGEMLSRIGTFTTNKEGSYLFAQSYPIFPILQRYANQPNRPVTEVWNEWIARRETSRGVRLAGHANAPSDGEGSLHNSPLIDEPEPTDDEELTSDADD